MGKLNGHPCGSGRVDSRAAPRGHLIVFGGGSVTDNIPTVYDVTSLTGSEVH